MAAILVQDVWKKYNIGMIPSLWQQIPGMKPRGIKSSAAGKGGKPFWALQDINFEVAEGEGLGVIGLNGAGKTTLLSILCGVTRATQGHVEVHGRTAPLISVGAGFQPELTGRENIFLNAVIMGMTRAEVRRKFDQIVDFSELEEFIDTPVKKYSSGMIVRLGFAVAAHLEPQVLLVDEVLSVGDVRFRRKCLDRIHQLRADGVTFLLVSHNMTLVEGAVDRCLLLERGEMKALGASQEVISKYYLSAHPELKETAEAGQGMLSLLARDIDRETRDLTIDQVWLEGEDGQPRTQFHGKEKVWVCIEYHRDNGVSQGAPPLNGFASITFSNEHDVQCMGTVLKLGDQETPQSFPDSGVIRVGFNPLQLTTDRYKLSIILRSESSDVSYARGRYGFLTVENDMSSGRAGDRGPLVLPPTTWSFDQKNTSPSETSTPQAMFDGSYPG